MFILMPLLRYVKCLVGESLCIYFYIYLNKTQQYMTRSVAKMYKLGKIREKEKVFI